MSRSTGDEEAPLLGEQAEDTRTYGTNGDAAEPAEEPVIHAALADSGATADGKPHRKSPLTVVCVVACMMLRLLSERMLDHSHVDRRIPSGHGRHYHRCLVC